METKTDVLEDIKLALPPSARVADLQKEIEKKLGWEPTEKLERCYSGNFSHVESFPAISRCWVG